jgi:hypothetical protein
MCDERINLIKPRALIFKGESYASNLKNTMKTNLERLDQANLERLEQAFVEVPSKEEINKFNLIKASLNHGFPSDSENALLLEPPFCHNAPLFMRVSLGRVQGQVEISRKVRHAPLATTTTRTHQ